MIRDAVDENEARNRSEFIEHLVELAAHPSLITVAPHCGAMERHTDHQAEYVARVLGQDRASAWMCKGWHRGGGAFAKWHITSQDISERSFPLLNTILQRRFQHAVAFHCYCGGEVLIGGGADLAVKTALQNSITETLSGSRINVRVVAPGNQYAGCDPANLVNRITADNNGIQIEQGRQAQVEYFSANAEAAAHVYRELTSLR
ncbi:poly-gamma-glutamate hydrolase family protein [Rhodococcus sp. 24CO]|uniref:poly-gamma-glutamate hydrolase family protein n=1 Tax=Rhodococcus sp. 24CO TaxID=3117460 RepID=UPI003D32B29F